MDAQKLARGFGVPENLIEGIEWDNRLRVDEKRRLGRLLQGFDLVVPIEWGSDDLMEFDGLVIPGNLICGAPKVKRLPDNLAVGGDLILGDSAVEQIPARMAHSGTLGTLDIQGVPIHALPIGLHVQGCLYAAYTEFTEAVGLCVDGNCDLAFSSVNSVRQTTIGGDLYLDGTDIHELGPDVSVMGGIFLKRCHNIKNHESVAPNLRDKVVQWPMHLGGTE